MWSGCDRPALEGTNKNRADATLSVASALRALGFPLLPNPSSPLGREAYSWCLIEQSLLRKSGKIYVGAADDDADAFAPQALA